MAGGIMEGETPDSVTGLLPSQKRAIVESWGRVCDNADKHGMDFFVRLFTEYPNAKQYFPKLHDCSADDLRRNTSLVSHAGKVMASITDLVSCLDHTLELVHSIQKIARDHRELGITASLFQTTLSVLQSTMKDALGDKYDEFTETAWRSCCDVIQKVIEAEYKTIGT